MVEPDTRTSSNRQIVVATLWIAILTGLVEAAGSVLMMRLGRRPGAWWDLFWVSPLFDVFMFGATGLVLTVIARAVRRPPLSVVLPVYGFLTASIVLGLALPYQVHILALLALSAGLGIQGARLIGRRMDAVLAFWERTLPAVAAAGVVAALTFLVGRPIRERVEIARLAGADASAPDVVLIVIDALRADHLSYLGYPRDTSPTLAQLAAEGASFTAAFSTAPYTGPSHASLLTGAYPSEHGVQWIERRPVLASDRPMISEALQSLGYRTAAISGNRHWFTREQGFGRGFHRFVENYRSIGDALVRTAYGRKVDEMVIPRLFDDYPWRLKSEEVTDRALAWADGKQDHPFFLMLNYFDVHDPYFPPDPYRGLYSEKDDPGGILNSYHQVYHADLSPEELQDEMDAYDGAIRYVDTEIGRLLEGLRGPDRDRDLLVIVTADHGEAFGEHGAYIHANSLYREEIHVPLIVWSPGRVPAGTRSERVVSNAAVPATIIELVGGGQDARFGVQSLARVWAEGLSPADSGHAFAEMEHWDWNLETSPSHYGAIQAVIGPEYHLIRNDSLGVELYRWLADSREAENLVAQDSLASTVTALERVLRSRLPRTQAIAPTS